MKARFFIAALLCAAVLFPVFAKGSGETKATQSKRIVVADANSTHHLSLYVAYEKGFFSKRGLDVVIEQTSAGVAAVVGGKRTLCSTAPPEFIPLLPPARTSSSSVR